MHLKNTGKSQVKSRLEKNVIKTQFTPIVWNLIINVCKTGTHPKICHYVPS